MVSYNHVGPPNSLNCQNTSGDTTAASGYVGPSGSAPATSNHPGGVNVCMADGSVRFVKDSVAPTLVGASAPASATKSSAPTPSDPPYSSDNPKMVGWVMGEVQFRSISPLPSPTISPWQSTTG